MAKKGRKSLLTMQREKLKKQKLSKKNTETFARGLKKMLFDSKGGPIKKVQSTKDALSRKRRASVKRTKAAVGSKGSSQKRLPAGKKGGAVVKSKGGSLAKRGGGGAATAAQAIGFTIAEKMSQTIGKKGQSRMSRLGIRGPAKPKPAKRGMSNIPPKEGTGKGSPNDKKTTSKVSASKTTKKPVASSPKARTAGSKKSAIHTYKKHGSALHVGRYKTLKEHRAAVAAQKKKKKK